MGLWADAKNIRDKDPAARNVAEVILLYPGFHVLVTHRIAHWLYNRRLLFLARLVSQLARHLTGIEIHPGAKIGQRLFTTAWASSLAKQPKSGTTAQFTTGSRLAVQERMWANVTPPWGIMF